MGCGELQGTRPPGDATATQRGCTTITVSGGEGGRRGGQEPDLRPSALGRSSPAPLQPAGSYLTALGPGNYVFWIFLDRIHVVPDRPGNVQPEAPGSQGQCGHSPYLRAGTASRCEVTDLGPTSRAPLQPSGLSSPGGSAETPKSLWGGGAPEHPSRWVRMSQPRTRVLPPRRGFFT